MGLKFEQTDESWSIFRFNAVRCWIAAGKLVRNQHHHLKKESFADDQNDFFCGNLFSGSIIFRKKTSEKFFFAKTVKTAKFSSLKVY